MKQEEGATPTVSQLPAPVGSIDIMTTAYKPGVIKQQVNLIQQVMSDVMKKDEHYGKIPGTDKPTLLKAGAEKLNFVFKLRSEFEIERTYEPGKYLGYNVKCKLYHIPTGVYVNSGDGSCNSRESKYRFRYVPTDKNPDKQDGERLKAMGLGRWQNKAAAKNNPPIWVWCERIENDNPEDLDNTILKMACKRAAVAATLNATAASDIFAQDLEDISHIIEAEVVNEQKPATEKQKNTQKETPTKPPAEIDADWLRHMIEGLDRVPDVGGLIAFHSWWTDKFKEKRFSESAYNQGNEKIKEKEVTLSSVDTETGEVMEEPPGTTTQGSTATPPPGEPTQKSMFAGGQG